MADRECYHCKEWIPEGAVHDCWTTTEAALTSELSDDLREAWARFREEAAALGDQRIYASGSCIMFARKVCYSFVRPKRSFLEVCIFLGRALKSPLVKRAEPTSKTKFANIVRIVHRDQVEAPITDWLQEAYALQDARRAKPTALPRRKRTAGKTVRPKRRKRAARDALFE